jgi:hypothetical protein
MNSSTNYSIDGLRTLWAAALSSLCLAALPGCSGGGDDPAPAPVPPPVAVPTPTPTPSLPPISDAALKQIAATFPAMPKESVELAVLRGGTSLTFSSGLPYNDLEYTIFDTDYIDGETNGFDTFMPVDPSLPVPGANQIKLITTTGNVNLDSTYGGQGGDRIILGTAEIASPFFLRGDDGVDNDYAVITSFNYKLGHIQLRGTATDYGLVRCTTAEGCKTDGYYLFHIVSGQPDLVAYIFRCDDLPGTAGGNQPQTSKAMCNASETLSLTDTNQFRFATPVSTTVTLPGQVQFGTAGKEVIGGITTDAAGNQYVVGLTDGSFNGGAAADNRIFAARVNADGTRGWTQELPMTNGSLLFDAITDSEYLYAVGRTLGALPGATSAGRWDGIILKIRLSDGVLVASSQWGNAGLDGYGNVVLDDAGNLYVSGAGSDPNGDGGTDPFHLVAKYRASDLSNVWRQIVEPVYPNGQVIASAEAWGGLSYAPGAAPGQGRLVAGGWFMGSGNGGISAQAFLEVWTDLHLATPRRAASTVIATAGVQADWVLDNAVDSAGNIYAVGYTSGSLQGTAKGQGDAYIVKYDANLQNPVFRQLGTAQGDAFRRMEIDAAGNLYAVGYTYGDYTGTNADVNKRTGDVIVQKFDSALNPVAAVQFGTPHEERSYMHLRGSTLYLGGMTEAALAGASKGSFDAFVVKVNSDSMAVVP